MPHDEALAARVRAILARRAGWVEKRMFGGACFLRRGHMAVGVWKEFLIARVGPEQYAGALTEPHARPFDVTGRAMTGWVMLEPDGVADDEALRHWVDRAAAFVGTLPPK